MENPQNQLKQALLQGKRQIGLWLTLGDATSAEICAAAGFDWLLIDGEHVPHSLDSVLAQLRAISGYPGTQAVARVPSADPVIIKQYLDMGVQSLLVPMVQSGEEAAAIVRACRYPPGGERGVGGARAARWGLIPDYLHKADEQIAIIVQVETRQALDDIDAIAGTEGVDGVFIGPADLSASLGHLGQPAHPDVAREILHVIDRIRTAGKAPGILTRDPEMLREATERGALLNAVGLDASLLAAQAQNLAKTHAVG
ncbi:HpcH/HpaI aldolase family protein [Sphingopyxis granuli]|uniref:2,4-dihydroxydec-2-ene-1,10-dioic acid aldolase n=1 Tax=Sphingopyxis granuli TaxID=267128 RepID=A0AA86GN07_9SPHN|nr:HpcH/HpaI aldolase/citrate lyase family protein [Sphingopyxis granuli]AMG75146.1 2,4-dihydroxydec-2-ene-1,10-dioic acid aldolase [Sphingopyxis granuli]